VFLDRTHIYNDSKYTSVIKELKVELKRQRELYNETDEGYPHIQKIVDEYWEK